MTKSIPPRHWLIAAGSLAMAASLALICFHPFGTGDRQDFAMGLPMGVGIALMFGAVLKKRRAG